MEKLFLSVLNMSLTASFVIVAIMLARLLLKKAPKTISYALWAVAGFRLVFPFSFESAFSLIPFKSAPIPTDIATQPIPRLDSGIRIVDNAVSQVLPAASPAASVDPLQVWLTVGSYLWAAGVAFMLIFGVVSLVVLNRRLHGANHLKENIYEADNLITPFVLGLFKPKIFIPVGLSEEEKRFIILHEQTHVLRRDHLVKFLAYAILCVHWFNPLAWAGFLMMSADMEMSCDERVLNLVGGETKKAYSMSLLSLAADRRIIGSGPLAFGEGGMKERINNILNFKKPSRVIMVVAAAFAAVLCVGFAVDHLGGENASPGEVYHFPSGRNDLVTENEANLFNQMTFSNLQQLAQKGDALTFEDFRDFKGGDASSNLAYHIMVYGVEGGYRLIVGTDGQKIDRADLESIWERGGNGIDIRYGDVDEFIKSHPSSEALTPAEARAVVEENFPTASEIRSSGWEKIEIGTPREVVLKIMGEPDFTLSGFFGDGYRIEGGFQIIFYYSADNMVNEIKKFEQDESKVLLSNTDINRDGQPESIFLDQSQLNNGSVVTLLIYDGGGQEIWSEDASTSHAGWNSLFLCEQEGQYYLLRYLPTMYQGYCSYNYTLFTLEGGTEHVVRRNSLEFDINGVNKLDAPKMAAFADEINALLAKSTLLLSSEGGEYAFGPAPAAPFFERFSWLDNTPELFETGDSLQTRLKKYSDYATSNFSAEGHAGGQSPSALQG